MDDDVDSILAQFGDDIRNPAVPQVRHVFLEGEAQHGDTKTFERPLQPAQQLDGLFGDEFSHSIIDAAAGQNDLRVVSDRLRFMRQVVRVHPDTMSTNQAWIKLEEVPFSPGRFQDRFRINAAQILVHCDCGLLAITYGGNYRPRSGNKIASRE